MKVKYKVEVRWQFNVEKQFVETIIIDQRPIYSNSMEKIRHILQDKHPEDKILINGWRVLEVLR